MGFSGTFGNYYQLEIERHRQKMLEESAKLHQDTLNELMRGTVRQLETQMAIAEAEVRQARERRETARREALWQQQYEAEVAQRELLSRLNTQQYPFGSAMMANPNQNWTQQLNSAMKANPNLDWRQKLDSYRPPVDFGRGAINPPVRAADAVWEGTKSVVGEVQQLRREVSDQSRELLRTMERRLSEAAVVTMAESVRPAPVPVAKPAREVPWMLPMVAAIALFWWMSTVGIPHMTMLLAGLAIGALYQWRGTRGNTRTTTRPA